MDDAREEAGPGAGLLGEQHSIDRMRELRIDDMCTYTSVPTTSVLMI